MALYYAWNNEQGEYVHQISRLKSEMKKEAVTQKELSEKTGMSVGNINRILNGNYVHLTDNFWCKMKNSGLNMLYVRFGIKD